MRTQPTFREDGTMVGFDIASAFVSMRLIKSLLRAVPGVSRVSRKHFSEDHVTFEYNGVKCTVNEPWGDNSHYWISPDNVLANPIDMSRVHNAFSSYLGLRIAVEWLLWVSAAIAAFWIIRMYV